MKEQVITYYDEETGAEITKWTNSPKDDQHLYFTSPSVTDDDRYLVIISDRNGHPNLYSINRETHQVIQISYSEGLLHSYTYPQGGSTGFSKASPYLDSKNNRVYWIQDDAVWASEVSESPLPIKVAVLPKGWVTGYIHLSSDGKKLCVPCADPRAFSAEDKTQHDQLKNVPVRLLAGEYKTRIILIDTGTGSLETLAETPFWVTHVQFDPNNDKIVLCNSEGGLASRANRSFPYHSRIWLIDENGGYTRLFNQIEGEYVNHENFMNRDSLIVYHGTKKFKIIQKLRYYSYIALNKFLYVGIDRVAIQSLLNHFVAVRNLDGEIMSIEEVDFPVSHAVAGNKDFFYLTDSRDGYIYGHYLKGKQISRIRVCKHGSSMGVQDAHPHPRASNIRDGVVFTSDTEGTCNVYEVTPKKLI